jgi:hypothetical protein
MNSKQSEGLVDEAKKPAEWGSKNSFDDSYGEHDEGIDCFNRFLCEISPVPDLFCERYLDPGQS